MTVEEQNTRCGGRGCGDFNAMSITFLRPEMAGSNAIRLEENSTRQPFRIMPVTDSDIWYGVKQIQLIREADWFSPPCTFLGLMKKTSSKYLPPAKLVSATLSTTER